VNVVTTPSTGPGELFEIVEHDVGGAGDGALPDVAIAPDDGLRSHVAVGKVLERELRATPTAPAGTGT
jgi:hypothetical protein